jgi:pyruvate formate lyase activating enzyme
MDAEYWEKEGNLVRCGLCPHRCALEPGQAGLCRVRENVSGRLENPYYGKASAIALDPIEKKPLYHFYPGSKILSIGFVGCNLSCPFCQNWEISQNAKAQETAVKIDALIEEARAAGSIGIAYTYSEPLMHIEFVRDCAKATRAAGLQNVLVTNGCVNEGPAQDILPLMDAINIDIKSFSEEVYRKELRGDLETVKNFTRLAAGLTHVELTTLLVTGLVEPVGEVGRIAAWAASISRDIPLHISAYYPAYRYNEPPTSIMDLAAAVQAAKRELRYVYPGNVTALDSATRCPVCGAVMVSRKGYSIEIGEFSHGRCERCGARIPIVMPPA